MAGLNVNIAQDPNYFWDLPGWTSQDLINASESGSSGEGGETSMLKAPAKDEQVSVAEQKAEVGAKTAAKAKSAAEGGK